MNNLITYLYGGGESVEQIDRAVLSDFEKMGMKKTMLFIPNAKKGPAKKEYFDWFSKYWEKYGIKSQMLDLDGSGYSDIVKKIKDADCIYLGGGNTFLLSDILIKSDLKSAIEQRLALKPLLLIGYSAGAVVMGKDIRSAIHIDNVGEKKESAGMGIVPFVVAVHYNDYLNKDNIDALVEFNHSPIICLPENTALRINLNSYKVICKENLKVIFIKNSQNQKEYFNGQEIILQ